MKKGFTLIELLGVIVILAIISLVATPVMINIIQNAKESSNQRSVELYAKAIMNAYVEYGMINNTSPSGYSDIEPYISMDNEPPDCEKKLYPNGSVYLSCTIDQKTYTYGNLYYCYSKGSKSTEIGTEYYCTFDDNVSRKYYVLDYDDSEKVLYLILNENFRNDDVPCSMHWCSTPSNCDEPDILNSYIDVIQELFGESTTVMIPTKEQIEGVPQVDGELPEWLGNFHCNVNGTLVEGFWTSTSYSSNIAYNVFHYSYDDSLKLRDGWLFGGKSGPGNGLRPVVVVDLNKTTSF